MRGASLYIISLLFGRFSFLVHPCEILYASHVVGPSPLTLLEEPPGYVKIAEILGYPASTRYSQSYLNSSSGSLQADE
jgi:hypothetical protein